MSLSRETVRWNVFVFLLAPFALTLSASVGRGEDPKIHAFDGFEEKLELQWEPVREDPTHVSLTKIPGKLTITTQRGTLGFDETRSVPAKNLYLISNPVDEGGDFVLTTCVESFKPTMTWQQAGLLIYDDDDNYLKYDMEWGGSDTRFKHMRETDQMRILDTDQVVPDSERTWIRITKRGNVYERAYSTDGKTFVSAGEKGWGDGAPQWVGLIAVNGSGIASDLDAAFDFFEVRALTDAEKKDPRYAERKKFQGTWEVASCEVNGKTLEHSPFSAFVFDGGKVTFSEEIQTITVDYTLDLSRDPKGFLMSALSRQAKRPVNGVYSLDAETLKICLAMQPDAPAPTELKTSEDDSRLLLTLKRASEEESPEEKPSE